jgi:hypothetical protein
MKHGDFLTARRETKKTMALGCEIDLFILLATTVRVHSLSPLPRTVQSYFTFGNASFWEFWRKSILQ